MYTADLYELEERFSMMTQGGVSEADALNYIRSNYPQKLYDDFLTRLNIAMPSFDTLRQYIDYGLTLLAGNDSKQFVDYRTMKPVKMPPDKKDAANPIMNIHPNAQIKTAEELKLAIKNGVKLFRFYPYEKNLLCVDLDRHGNADGVKKFNELLSKPDIDMKNGFFADIEKGSFPLFAKSPNNGYHLYFKTGLTSWSRTHKPKSKIRYENKTISGIDVIFASGTLTAAGSVKKTEAAGLYKPYVLSGNWKNIPDLPLFFARLLTQEAAIPDNKPSEKRTTNAESLVAASKRKNYNSPSDAQSAICKAVCNCLKNGYSAMNEYEIKAALYKEFTDITPDQIDNYSEKYFRQKDGLEYIESYFLKTTLVAGDRHNGVVRACGHFMHKKQEGKIKFPNGDTIKRHIIDCIMRTGAYTEAERNSDVVPTVRSFNFD